MSEFFAPKSGTAKILFIVGGLIFSIIVIGLLTLVPPRFRKHIIRAVTLLGGLFFALEFFWPVHPAPDDPKKLENFLTPYVVPFGDVSLVIAAWTVGLGVTNLCQMHGKRLMRGGAGAFNSLAFFVSMILMLIINILATDRPNLINKNLNKLLFDGALQSLDATMFSIIAFYIVSAAYRAFRVRSVEATLLLLTAVIVMLGQFALGILLTSGLPDHGLWSNLRVENLRNWIMNQLNNPAQRAISFGLGVGGLAVALRIWLGLERGSYFEQQG